VSKGASCAVRTKRFRGSAFLKRGGVVGLYLGEEGGEKTSSFLEGRKEDHFIDGFFFTLSFIFPKERPDFTRRLHRDR